MLKQHMAMLNRLKYNQPMMWCLYD